MSDIVLYSIISISAIGLLAAIILYFVAEKFKVYEDPRIDEVEEALPSANCGGCGFPGCRNFAEACVKADSLDDLYCPVGGNEVMQKVASIIGLEAKEVDPMVAVVRCNGTPEHRPRLNSYEGALNCTIASSLYLGETDCQYGCLGYGDCVAACDFDAIYMDEKTQLPVVIDDKCTACGACVEACPKDIIELRKRNKKDRKIFVACVSQDKGATTKKACEVGCIGCSACFKVCKYDAITMTKTLAFIDSYKCVLCRACVEVCPTNSILEINFPPRKAKKKTDKKATDKKTTSTKKTVEKKTSDTTKTEQVSTKKSVENKSHKTTTEKTTDNKTSDNTKTEQTDKQKTSENEQKNTENKTDNEENKTEESK